MVKVQKTDQEWKQHLSDEQYRVLRQKGTEQPFSGKYVIPRKSGDYYCIGCGELLFKAGAQHESTTKGLRGWPGFDEAANSNAVKLNVDKSHGMVRTEVTCASCGSHLGHLFDDSSLPSGKHYCINSVCLDYKSDKNETNEVV